MTGLEREGGVASFGEELRREREVRGFSVESICDATKVSAKHILALEADSFADMPGGVFRRGFVRSYLGALGLEEAPWMRRFEQTCRDRGVADPVDVEWATFAENVKNNRASTRSRNGLKWVGVGAMVLVLLLAGWCCWRFVTHQSLMPPVRLYRPSGAEPRSVDPAKGGEPQP